MSTPSDFELNNTTSLMKNGDLCFTFPLAGISLRPVGWHRVASSLQRRTIGFCLRDFVQLVTAFSELAGGYSIRNRTLHVNAAEIPRHVEATQAGKSVCIDGGWRVPYCPDGRSR